MSLLSTGTASIAALAQRNTTVKRAVAATIWKTTSTRSISSSGMACDGELAERCDVHILSSPYTALAPNAWNKTPVPDLLLSAWKERSRDKNNSDTVAIFDGSTGMKRTFAEYYEDTAGIAGSLKHDLEINENSCVCVFAPNHVDYLPVTLAVGLCGGTITPVNPLFTTEELRTVLDKSRSSLLIAHKNNLGVALEAARGARYLKHVLVMTEDGEVAPGGLDSLESIKRHDQSFDATSDSYRCEPSTHQYLLPYSSGTTGLPKGTRLSHANLAANLHQYDTIDGPQLKPGDSLFSPMPFFHIYGMVVSMMYYGWKGCPVYTMSGGFDFELMLQMIQNHRPSHAHLVPPIMLGLAKSPLIDNYDVSSLRSIISGASPLGRDIESVVRKRLDCTVKQGWGMSELSPIGSLAPTTTTDDSKAGSVGPLLPNTLGKIIDDQGTSLGPNEEGELVVKGPQVMMGYLDEPEKTEECLSSSGWLRTGDMAYYDDDGFLYITDRIKELIKTRGFQVAPAELEHLLLGHEDVSDVAVIQIPDEESGELPLAYIVLKDGCADDEASKQRIYDWVKERVAPHKRLDGGIRFTDAIPKSASGKILRRILRSELAEELSGSALRTA